MSTLAQKFNQSTVTENGAPSFASTDSALLDLFYQIGGLRGANPQKAIDLFDAAFAASPEHAIRILFWARDVRGGAGERQVVRDILKHTAESGRFGRLVVQSLIHNVATYGRWDDLMAFWGTEYESAAATYWVLNIEQGNGLAAKWAPRKDSKGAKPLRDAKGFNEKLWRKFVVPRTEVVEQKMCANRWEDIDYEKVPSLAMTRYNTAFGRHDGVRFSQFGTAVAEGTAKVNAGAVYPYDIVKGLGLGNMWWDENRETANEDVLQAQWDSLPNYMEGVDERILPVVDTSGSMGVAVSGQTTALDVAVSLGLYISERNVGKFQNEFVTFSAVPHFQRVEGTLKQRATSMMKADWDMNTDFHAVFEKLLNTAHRYNLSQEEMPTKILVLSDMQFDQAHNRYDTPFEDMRSAFEKSGYEFPQLVFWNLASRAGNVPLTKHESGAALVSGFSPAILTSLLGGSLTPESVMMDAIMTPRYDLAATVSY